MSRRATKPTIRARVTRHQNTSRGSRRNSALKSGSAHGPRISHARLRAVRDELDGTKAAISDTFDKFWIIPEHHIRETLGKTQQKIGRALKMLKRAA